jgi:hypothetical protein
MGRSAPKRIWSRISGHSDFRRSAVAVNVETVDARGAFADPDPLPSPLQVLTLKDSFKPSFACVVRVLARALDFVAGQITRGFTPP